MVRREWLAGLCLVCVWVCGCGHSKAKKYDPTKGRVTGIVYCADTGRPARFARVTLTAAPATDEKHGQQAPLPEEESATTDLEGRFTMEAVEPGHYYAFATQEGYLDPERGLDIDRIAALKDDREEALEAIKEWRDHLVEVRVAAQRTSDLTLQMQRAGEIDGTVTFDDGSPAIGMHFRLYRKTAEGGWTGVGLAMFSDWSLPEVSDSHGHFSVSNLRAGEYAVCAMLPVEGQDSAPQVCMGNAFRRKDAALVKVGAGETVRGADISIPLTGFYTVAGVVTALADGRPMGRGTVRLLYADDRERMRETRVQQEDGSFEFEYVPPGSYILQVADGGDGNQGDSGQAGADGGTKPRSYTDKEMPLLVNGNVEDVSVQLVVSGADETAK